MPAMADDCEGRAGQNKHRWNPEAENTVCKDSRRERTFSERYLSVMSNLANLDLCTAVMQRSVRVGVLYPGRSVAIIVSWWFYVCIELYNHSAWAGLRCLSLERGNARARLQG